ncbi:MAG: DinB family protein, partial [Mucilaginibacter polytrichastri]|nr:DinB family protein [Mucilaginibacter polytrichastri]
LQTNRNDVIATARDMDLSMLCLGFDFPGLGFLTRYEWLYFNIYHTQRHIRQLRNILGEW